MSTLRAWRGILRMVTLGRMQYRTVMFSRIAVNAFWGAAHSVIMLVYFRYGGGGARPMSAAQAVSFVWLGQIFFNLLPGHYDAEVWEKIRTGDIAAELIRPLGLYGHWFMRTVSIRLAPFLMAVVPISLIGFLMPAELALMPPASAEGFLAFLILMVGALIFSCSAQCLLYSMMVSSHWGHELTNIVGAIMQILAGAYLPLALWPDAIQRFLLLQPFAGAQDLPLRMYLGMLEPSALPGILALQLAWSGVFIALGWWRLKRGTTRIVIQGG